MARFSYSVSHVPGKLLHTADALSRSPTEEIFTQLQDEWFIETITSSLPAGEHGLQDYNTAQDKDPACTQVKQWCKDGWPRNSPTDISLVPYYKVRSSFTLHNNLLLYNQHIVVPPSLRQVTMEKIHDGHQGIERCRARVRCSVWWPGVNKQVAERVHNCTMCAQEAQQRREPLMKSTLPDYPWQVIGTDLFELNGTKYLLVVDYFSRYPEVTKMNSTTSPATIAVLKSVFAYHGIPEVVCSDNGPQYASTEFSEFAQEYGFRHVTSSPKCPQSNGLAEQMVQTIKHSFKHTKDLNRVLLSYRSTPLPWCNRSPAELCMGRQIRTWVPMSDQLRIPQWSYLPEFKSSDTLFRKKQKEYFDKSHRSKELPSIPNDTKVWVESENGPVSGRVISSAQTPRSYIVETSSGQIQRNRSHLRVAPETTGVGENPAPTSSSPESASNRIMTRSQTETEIRRPPRYTYT